MAEYMLHNNLSQYEISDYEHAHMEIYAPNKLTLSIPAVIMCKSKHSYM